MKKNPHRCHGQESINTRIIGELFSYDLQLLETDAIDSHDSYLECQNHTQYGKRNKKHIESFVHSGVGRQIDMYLGSSIDDDK